MRVPDQLDVTPLDLRAYERTRVKRLWDRFRPYADANFAQELIGNFHERYWEMCLVYVILRRGMRLRERSMTGGPDISIQSEKGTIWVEATAPGPGTTADAVPQPKLVDLDWLLLCEDPLELLQEIEESDEIASAPEEAIILRYRNALDEKLRKYSKYIKQQVISPTEPYVVAINGASVHPIFGAGAVIPIIAKAVLALGQLQFVFPQNLAGEPTKHIEVRYAVQKKERQRGPDRYLSQRVLQRHEWRIVFPL